MGEAYIKSKITVKSGPSAPSVKGEINRGAHEGGSGDLGKLSVKPTFEGIVAEADCSPQAAKSIAEHMHATFPGVTISEQTIFEE